MSKKLKGKDAAGGYVQHYIIRELRKAKTELESGTLSSQLRIHLARKCLKRVRAVLELVREEEPYVYSVEKRAALNISKRLAGYRDDDAMIETLDRIHDTYSDRLPGKVYKSLWQSFVRQRDVNIVGRADRSSDVESAVTALARAAQRLRLVSLRSVSIKSLMTARTRSLRRMCKARNQALKDHNARIFHRWRQRTKMLLYQEQFLKKLGHGNKQTIRQLETIGELLGCANDAANLNAYLDRQADSLKIDQNIEILRSLAEEQQSILRYKALAATVEKLH